MPWQNFFKDKKVTVLGLGLLGRGVGDAEFIAQMGAQVTVTDLKTERELEASIERLKKYPNISFHLGGHMKEDFTTADMVIKAAGVPITSAEIKAAREAGAAVYMSTALFAKFAREAGARIIGVTGTRGKSTVTQMIYHVLKQSAPRRDTGREGQVLLGGNIRGLSTLAMLPEVKNGDVCVLELDSWQLQGFGDLEISPDIAVFTNLMPDHLNYYPNMRAYFLDKANIFKSQKLTDTLIAGETIIDEVRAEMPPVAPKMPATLPAGIKLMIPGEHNRINAAFALEALRALGMSDEEIHAGLETFPGVEGRLQLIKDVHGIKIYNDNNATTPEAAIAALRSFPERTIILICGGSDKGLDLEDLVAEIQRTCKKVVLLKGTGTAKLEPQVMGTVHDSLQSAFADALEHAKSGDVILFSPAFASFGMFKNEYDRNDQFVQIVNSVA